MTRTRAAVMAPGAALSFLLAGLVARVTGAPDLASTLWMLGLLVVGLPVVVRTLRQALHGHFATDLIAMLAIIGAIGLRQPLAGLMVVLMQTGGEALERYAEGHASRALQELERLAPRIAHRVQGELVEDCAIEQIIVGDIVLVRPGELVPCDGVVESGEPLLDLSRLTGEPLPVAASAGTRVRSGGHNLESPFELRVSALAGESEYARIVDLVRSAQASKAPLQRLADRYAVWFTPLTVLACAVTYFVTHDPVRVLAVLVVATPCPLILATPVAVVGGISRAASRGIVFRNGAALEQLATVHVAVFDKTGTLTIGRPDVAAVRPAIGFTADAILSLAASVEHGSGHLLARTVVEAAAARGLTPAPAAAITEEPGQGVSGTVGAQQVAVGGWRWIRARHPASTREFQRLQNGQSAEGLRAYVTVDGQAGGIVEYADRLRPEIAMLITDLARLGVRRTLLLSGDRDANARQTAKAVGIAEAHGDLTPSDKTAIVQGLIKGGERVLMVGDGTNDAPALSAATVGIALASGGGGIAAEAADAVILANDPRRIAEAVEIGRRTLRVAQESIWVGLGLSGAAMVVASLGMLPPAVGAMVQETIDVAVILNALRTSGAPRQRRVA